MRVRVWWLTLVPRCHLQVLPGEESNAGTLSREASTHSNPNSGNNSTRRRRRSSTASGAHISRRTSFIAPGKMSKMGSMEPVRPAGGMAQSPSRGQHSIKGGKLPHLSSRKSADVPRVVEEERGHKVTELTALPAAGAGGAGSPTSQAQHSAAVDGTAAAAGEPHPTILPPLSEAMIENVAFAAGQLLHHPSSPPRHALAVGLDQRGPGGGVIGIGLVKQMMGGQPEEDAGTVLSRCGRRGATRGMREAIASTGGRRRCHQGKTQLETSKHTFKCAQTTSAPQCLA